MTASFDAPLRPFLRAAWRMDFISGVRAIWFSVTFSRARACSLRVTSVGILSSLDELSKSSGHVCGQGVVLGSGLRICDPILSWIEDFRFTWRFLYRITFIVPSSKKINRPFECAYQSLCLLVGHQRTLMGLPVRGL